MRRGGSGDLERRALQAMVALGACVPVAGGLTGVIAGVMGPLGSGATWVDGDGNIWRDLVSHGTYLSGLLLGIGLAYWSTIPRIEDKGPRFRLLTGIVLVGGLARLASLFTIGVPSAVMVAALVMELAVAPALALWRERVERIGRAAA